MTEPVLQPECYKRHAAIEGHIEEGKMWRGAIIGIILTVLLQIGSFIYFYGRLTYMVEIDSKRLYELESLFPRSKGDRGEKGVQGIQGIPGKDYGVH